MDKQKSVLKQRIILPAGLKVMPAPKRIEIRHHRQVASMIFELTPNTFGEVLYYFDENIDEQERQLLLKFFPESFVTRR